MPDTFGVLDRISATGFAVLPSMGAGTLVTVGATLGTPVAEPRDGVLVKPLRPVAAIDAPRNTLSERYGAGAFPLHTEAAYWRCPPRFLLLHCVDPGADSPQGTIIMDGAPLASGPHAKTLRMEPWVVSAAQSSFLSTIVDTRSRSPVLRFDRECMRPARLTSPSPAIVEAYIASAPRFVHKWRAGDLLVIDNHRILHGRTAAEESPSTRLLLKMMIATSRMS